MQGPRRILVSREEIARAGGVKAAVDEALSLAALGTNPRALTAYEAVGSAPTDTDGVEFIVIAEVRDETELREAVEAGAETVRLMGVDETNAHRLGKIGQELREDLKVERG